MHFPCAKPPDEKGQTQPITCIGTNIQMFSIFYGENIWIINWFVNFSSGYIGIL